ncbi:hypothetical protein [Mucilaginibacter sp.]|uniref:hypothetical protein n=1 Tax=Mucilaginibacter sp. TaxID=1882438 RepID=UPI0035BC24F8
MKKLLICAAVALAFSFGACKGKTENNSADSSQVHTGNQGVNDSAKIETTPVETGGKDTSGNGAGTTNMPKDTLTTTQK